MFKLRNLIKFRNNPKITNKIINNLEISKEDKKTLMEDLKSIETGSNVEDNLSKVERAFILDYDKFEEWDNIFSKVNSFKSCIVISDILPHIFENYSGGGYVNFEDIYRYNGSVGFTVSSLTCNNDETFNAIKDYMIEVPVDEFYGISNKRVYFCDKSKSKEMQLKEVKNIINELYPNIAEGEEVAIKGYIIYIPQAYDDFGCITHIKKENNKLLVRFYLNGGYSNLNFYDIDNL